MTMNLDSFDLGDFLQEEKQSLCSSKVRPWVMQWVSESRQQSELSGKGLFVLAMFTAVTLFNPDKNEDEKSVDNLVGTSQFFGDCASFELGIYLYFRVLTFVHFVDVAHGDKIADEFLLRLGAVFSSAFEIDDIYPYIFDRVNRYKELSSDINSCLDQLSYEVLRTADRSIPVRGVASEDGGRDHFFGYYSIVTTLGDWEKLLIPELIKYIELYDHRLELISNENINKTNPIASSPPPMSKYGDLFSERKRQEIPVSKNSNSKKIKTPSQMPPRKETLRNRRGVNVIFSKILIWLLGILGGGIVIAVLYSDFMRGCTESRWFWERIFDLFK